MKTMKPNAVFSITLL